MRKRGSDSHLIPLVVSLFHIDKCTHSNSEPEKCYPTNSTIGSLLSMKMLKRYNRSALYKKSEPLRYFCALTHFFFFRLCHNPLKSLYKSHFPAAKILFLFLSQLINCNAPVSELSLGNLLINLGRNVYRHLFAGFQLVLVLHKICG